MSLFNKRASLELSIRAIVIVVLAMTILSLGLVFVRERFKEFGTISSEVTEQVRQRIVDDLVTGDKKISFPKTEIAIDKGGSELLTIGIRNKNNLDLRYYMDFKEIDSTSLGPGFDTTDWFLFGTGEYILPSADTDVRSVKLTIPTSVPTGSYFLNFEVIHYGSGEVYASKDFFIVVRG